MWSTRAGVDQVWQMNTGTVAVYGGSVFVPISSIEVAMVLDSNYNCCTSSGGVVALDSKTGKVLWYHRVVPAAAATTTMKKEWQAPFTARQARRFGAAPLIDCKKRLALCWDRRKL